MADPRLAEVDKLKENATAKRNLGQFERALGILKEVITILEAPSPDHGPMPSNASDVRTALADTYGMIGGVFRRIGDLDAALTAYQTGAKIEESDNLDITYNRSNVITLSITREGLAPTDDTIRKYLASVIGPLEVATAGLAKDEWWAWADLAQFYLLNGEPDKARARYKTGIDTTGPTSDQKKRHLTILDELADKTASTVPGIAASIRAVIHELSD